MMRLFITILPMFFMSQPVKANSESEAALESLREAAFTHQFEAISADEQALARTLFQKLLKFEDQSELAPFLESLELEVEALSADLLIVKEADSRKTGRGFFAFRSNNSAVILQSPHSQADLGTGKITAQLMARQNFRAAAWNSAHRNNQTSGMSDLARLQQSYFIALSQAAIDIIDEPVLLQLHGFDTDKRTTDAGRASHIIISSGEHIAHSAVLARAACLQLLTVGVAIYPLDVTELGGTINPVGELIRANRLRSFLHIEFDQTIRKQLLDDNQLIQETGICLLGEQPTF